MERGRVQPTETSAVDFGRLLVVELPWHPGNLPGCPPSWTVVNMGSVTANGKSVQLAEPCSLEEFLRQWGFLPRSVVVEHNGEPVAPSEFARRSIQFGDRLEIVRIVAGG